MKRDTVIVLGLLLIGGIVIMKPDAPVKPPPTPIVPTGPFKSVDAQYLVNMSKHGTEPQDVELVASCERSPWKDWAVHCIEISEGGLVVNVAGHSVSGATAKLDQCKEIGQSGCAFKVRFTFTGGSRQDTLVKEADVTIPRVVVSADHVIVEAIN